MSQAKSWMTSDDIIASVKRRISFPTAQQTFTNDDILAFANEELLTSQLPSILQYHEEYYVYKVKVPLVSNVSRYAIPDRAIGMRLQDLKWSDQDGNFFDMTRISSTDKGFFQRSTGANQQIHKFYVEGNDVILTPQVVDGPTGALNFFIFIRPNQLVDNTRAAFIKSFMQTITLSGVSGGDTLYLNGVAYSAHAPTYTFTVTSANATAGATYTHNGNVFLVSSTISGSTTLVTTSVGTPLTSGTLVLASGSGDATITFSSVSGPTQSSIYYFNLGASDIITASNLATFINSSNIPGVISATSSSNKVIFRFTNQNYSFFFSNKSFDAFSNVNIIPNTFTINSHGLANNTQIVFTAPLGSTLPTNILPNVKYYVINATTNTFQISLTFSGPFVPITGTGSGTCFIQEELSSPSFIIPQTTSQIEFVSLPSAYTNPTTNITEPLFINSVTVDFLQTKPGHKIENYDVMIPTNGISGNIITFNAIDIPSTAIIGDYICLSNECIIPYLPPDLHNILSERTAARILSAIGDQQGLQNSMQKLAEMEKLTGELVDNRIESSAKKITARHSLLHYSKSSYRRRY